MRTRGTGSIDHGSTAANRYVVESPVYNRHQVTRDQSVEDVLPGLAA